MSYSETNEKKKYSSLIEGYADWMRNYGILGYRLYYLNIMFRPLAGNLQAILAQMERAICDGFYPRLCTEFAHHPTKPSQQKKLPMLFLFPDRPIWKHEGKTSIREMQFNANGIHYNGPIMFPMISRFKGSLIEHIHNNQRKYAIDGITRIHVKDTNWDLDGLADYAGKTVRWDKELREHIILLPDPDAQRGTKTEPMTMEERAIKDYQSRHNVSDEIAKRALGISAR